MAKQVTFYIGLSHGEEEKVKEALKKHLEFSIHEYTMLDTQGSWKGREEPGVMVIILFHESFDDAAIHRLGAELRQVAEQDCVLVVLQPATLYFV
jgi:hypothetical protein